MRTRILAIGCLGGCLLMGTGAAREKPTKVLFRPPYNPDAARIDVFDGIEQGALAVQVKPRDANGGSLFIENLTAEPLTVELPEVVVGVQVLPQVGLPFQVPGGSLNGNQPQQAGLGLGQNQPVGGTANGNTTGNRNNTGRGNNNLQGFFSVPPERIARIEYSSVCLEHGAEDPRPGNVYRLVHIQEFSKDARLARLLQRVGQSGENPAALQAAAWHIANGMTWDDLHSKQRRHLNAPSEPYFARQDLRTAEAIVRDVETQLAARDVVPAPTVATDDKSPRLSKAGR